MEIPIINIGNSKGIRIPKTILEEYGFENNAELIFEENQIILKPIAKPRVGWEDKFREMVENKDDQLLFDDVFEDENFEEWN